MLIIALFAVFFSQGIRAQGYTVPQASQQPKTQTYMYCKDVQVKIDGKLYTQTICHAANGKNYVQ